MANALTVSRPPVGTAVSVIRGLPGDPIAADAVLCSPTRLRLLRQEV